MADDLAFSASSELRGPVVTHLAITGGVAVGDSLVQQVVGMASRRGFGAAR